MITISQPATPTVQESAKCISFDMRLNNGEWIAEIGFELLDSTGKGIGQKTIQITRENWNTFWTGFNSGSFLYSQLSGTTVTDQDGDFVNPSK